LAEKENDEIVDNKSGSKKKFLIIGGGVAVLIIAGAALFFLGIFDGNKSDEVVNEVASGEPVVEAELKGDPIYLELTPAFKVNFKGNGIKVMKLVMSVMSFDPKTIDAVKLHDPVIRNNILMLLSNQEPETLKKRDAKEVLQTSIKDEINKTLLSRKLKLEIDDVFFTDMVMQ